MRIAVNNFPFLSKNRFERSLMSGFIGSPGFQKRDGDELVCHHFVLDYIIPSTKQSFPLQNGGEVHTKE